MIVHYEYPEGVGVGRQDYGTTRPDNREIRLDAEDWLDRYNSHAGRRLPYIVAKYGGLKTGLALRVEAAAQEVKGPDDRPSTWAEREPSR